jgi:hypothetical protein
MKRHRPEPAEEREGSGGVSDQFDVVRLGLGGGQEETENKRFEHCRFYDEVRSSKFEGRIKKPTTLSSFLIRTSNFKKKGGRIAALSNQQ